MTSENDTQVALADISRGLIATTTLIQTLNNDIRGYSMNQIELKMQINAVQDMVKNLARIITDSNGHSLVTRLALVEDKLTSLSNWKKDQEGKEKDTKSDSERFRWQIRAALTSGGISALVAIVLFVLTLATRK